MTSERTALMLAANDAERCTLRSCDTPIEGEPVFSKHNHFEEPFCSKDCAETWEEIQNERAHERMLENFYGGSSPVTLDEQRAKATAFKYGGKEC
jgi:hypothetical protein